MGAEFSHPVDKDSLQEIEQCARACAIFDLTEKYTKENEFLAGMSRDDAEAIITAMVDDSECQTQTVTAVVSGDTPYATFQGRVRIPIEKDCATPGVARRSRQVVSQDTWAKCLQACSPPNTAGEPTQQEHGTLGEVTDEEAAAIMAVLEIFGQDGPTSSILQTCKDPSSPFLSIPPEFRTSQSAQIVINEPPRDVKGKKRAIPEPEEDEEEEADRNMHRTTRFRRWPSQSGEGSSKDGETLTELLAKNSRPKTAGCDEPLVGVTGVNAEKAEEQDRTICGQEKRPEVFRRFSGGVL